MKDPYKQTTGTGLFPWPQWFHGESPDGYPPERRPNLAMLTRLGQGVNWSQTTRVHPVPICRTGRLTRVASPPGRAGRTPGEGSMTSYVG